MTAPLLFVDGLSKSFGGLAALDQVDLTVQAGEIHALIGPNGAGKTTLIHHISGAMQADAGRIVFDGHDVTKDALHQRARQGLVRSYQVTSVFPDLSVQDNLALAILATEESSFGFWRAASAERARYAQADAMAERIGLAHHRMQAAGALSHGAQRQLEVGLVLCTNPKLMLLDEPMAGMGPDESQRMVELLQSLRAATTTILLVEHDMDAVFRLADTISVLVSGRVVATGNAEQIKNDATVQRAYLGDA
jgi:branched-chain amino acid transport system ATP-binding protein